MFKTLALVGAFLISLVAPAMADQRISVAAYAPQNVAFTQNAQIGLGASYTFFKFKHLEFGPTAYVGRPLNFTQGFFQPGAQVSYFLGDVGLTVAEVHKANTGYNAFTSSTFAPVLGLSLKI